MVDLNVRNLTAKDLSWADCAYVSAMVVQRKSTNRVITELKAAGITVVAGGPLFTSEPESFEAVDHLVLNEAETTLRGFLSDLESGKPQRVYNSSAFCDITQTPAPKWDLLDLSKYASMCIQFSRGCPFNCDFCNVTTLFGRKTRVKTAGQMVAELDGLYSLGWRSPVFFVDDNFIGNKPYLKTRLLPAIINWKRGKKDITFNTEASINLADDEELMGMMVKAGFDSVFIGIETPNEESLAECGKRQNRNRDLLDSVKSIHRAGLQVQAGFIVGFDHDSPGIFQRHIDFIQNSGVVTAMVGLLQAPSGTRLYARATVRMPLKLAGGSAGQPLSSEITSLGCRPCTTWGEAIHIRHKQRVTCRPCGVRDLSMCGHFTSTRTRKMNGTRHCLGGSVREGLWRIILTCTLLRSRTAA